MEKKDPVFRRERKDKTEMKKIFLLLFALLLTGALLAGCGKSETPAGTAAEEATGARETESKETEAAPATAPATEPPVEEESKLDKYPVADAPFDPETGMTENMIARSVYYEGDTARLKAKLAQVFDESYTGQTNVFFLGDSISDGSGSSGGSSFRKLVTKWFTDNAKSTTVCQNASIGATDSYLAVHRVDKDVLSKNPDVIFIEFINDLDNDFYKATMESLIRKCLAAPTNPAVVLIEMVLEDGGNCQACHAASAKAYGVPVLSYRDAVMPEVEAGNFRFRQISGDGTHPNYVGHAWTAEIITHFLEQVKDDPATGEVKPFDPATPSITGDRYAKAGLYDKESANLKATPDANFTLGTTPSKFKKGWGTNTVDSTITFEAEFANFGLLYYKTTDGKTGIVNVKIDGASMGFVNGNFPNGWGDYPAAVELYTSNEAKTHTVTITVTSANRQHFEILALLMS